MQEADGVIVISESELEESHVQEADGDIVTSESESEKLHVQEADGDIVISESESEELHMQEADGDIVISESEPEGLHMQEADGDAESYCKQLPLQEDIATCEDLFLQKANENVVSHNVSENPMVADGTIAILNNCSSRVVMKDSGRLLEDALRNTLSSNVQIKLQTGVCKDPLLAAKRNSLGRP